MNGTASSLDRIRTSKREYMRRARLVPEMRERWNRLRREASARKRSHRESERLFRARLQRSERQKRYRLRHREERNRESALWKTAHKKRLSLYNRRYRLEVLGHVCWFCGNGGHKEHPLQRVTRMVAEQTTDVFEERRVLICWQCRGAAPKNRNGGRPPQSATKERRSM